MAQKNQIILQAVSQFGKQLTRFIRVKVPTLEDAEDVMQDVWYQLSIVEEIEKIDSMSGWLFRVAKNKITDRFRKKKTKSLEDFSYVAKDGELLFKQIILEQPNTFEDAYFNELFWEELICALDELPEKQRMVFVKNELEDMSLQEIANETGENLKTIISRKGYAVKHIRERMQELYNEFLND